MKKKKVYNKILKISTCLLTLGFLAFSYVTLKNSVPDNIRILVNDIEEFDFKVPMSADFIEDNIGVISVNHESVPANQIKLDLKKPFSINSTATGDYKIQLKLFGFINLKEVNLDVIEVNQLIPSGEPIGIYIETNGVMVLGTGVITGEDGYNYEPSLNKLKSGDYVMEANGIKLTSKEQLLNLVLNSNGNEMELQVRRDEELFDTKIKPVIASTGEYRIGAWIRDNTQGIGTLTFQSLDGRFGALGHGITDIDTSLIMEIDHGSISRADIIAITKGRQGAPGELIGVINQSEANYLGSISKNTSQGIYGLMGNKKITNEQYERAVPIGLKQDLKIGPATILSCVENEVKEYDIVIEKIELNSQSPNKGMVIRIVDQKLIELTGGIVQGMSGSPIMQNGKIVGAVTHVFIQDSTKGYGTFIENMLVNIED